MSEKVVNSTLNQQSHTRGEVRSFEIYNAKFMKIMIHDLFGEKSYHINLTMLEPWPIQQRHIAWRWAIAFSYFLLCSGAFFYAQYQSLSTASPATLMVISVVFVLLSLFSLVMLIHRSPNFTEFRSRYGNCPVLHLIQNNPDKTSFAKFIKEIKTRILAASQNVTYDKKQMLTFELKELQRLLDEGILLKNQFELAKERVVKMQL